MRAANTQAIIQSCYDKLQRVNSSTGDVGLTDWQADLLSKAVGVLELLIKQWAKNETSLPGPT